MSLLTGTGARSQTLFSAGFEEKIALLEGTQGPAQSGDVLGIATQDTAAPPAPLDSAGLDGMAFGSEADSEKAEDDASIRRTQTVPARGSQENLADCESDPVFHGEGSSQNIANFRSLPAIVSKTRRSLPALTMLPAIKRSIAAIKHGPLATNAHILRDLLLDPINVLLVAAPFGIAGEFCEWPRGLTFALCFLALVPLAKLLGDATEHLAENLSQTIGGLLNATFGNAVEMIITLSAIKSGLLDIVKNSLLGSILSNLLLVLGMAFFAGGLSKQEQRFSGAAALINVTMLLVGVMSFSLPTVFSLSKPEGSKSLEVSRDSAVFVSVGYVAYLVFQLHTHIEIFEDDSEDGGSPRDADLESAANFVPGTCTADAQPATPMTRAGGAGEAEDGILSVPWAMGLLLASTVAVAVLSEIMVDSIDGMVEAWRVPRAFVGVILLPIVGNACEHASAVRMAYNSKMGTAIAIAVGSSTQIAMFVMPFSVLAGWVVGQPLDLNLGATGLAVMFLSVLVVFSIVMDGKSNWLEGFLLTLAYGLVAVLYWHTD